MKHTTALAQVSQILLDIQLPHPTRVGIDGVDGSGKTRLADELADELKRRRQNVLRVSLDDFHNPRAVRYRPGQAHYLAEVKPAALADLLWDNNHIDSPEIGIRT